MADETHFTSLNDQALLVKIKENSDYLGIVYKRCKANCLGFMRKMTNGALNDYELEDVFQDANIILYEKIVNGDFVLTASFQTYLNAVCRFQLLNTLGKSKLTTDFQDNSDDGDDENPNGYYSSITDSLDGVDHSNEAQFLAIEKALEKMKAAGGHCYELLTLFWYHKKSMNELTTEFGYNNSDTTKNQKARCQKRLEKLAYNELNN
ncbi:MAG: RNA polymerase subunit sigma-70 [Flavobacterium sp. BFFFF2]|nr:MAG: RNA polymerase subunit sigma-70 [Flavobacterium sp. BFFFF2]